MARELKRRMRLSSEQGQTSTEYMILVSVVVIAILSAAYTFVPSFESGVQSLGADVQSILDVGTVGGLGLSRGGASPAPMGPAAPRGGSNSMEDAGRMGHLPKSNDPLSGRCTDHC